jgi:hypothetical protein
MTAQLVTRFPLSRWLSSFCSTGTRVRNAQPDQRLANGADHFDQTNPTMQELDHQTTSAEARSAQVPRIKVGVMPLFFTWVFLCRDGLVHLNESYRCPSSPQEKPC